MLHASRLCLLQLLQVSFPTKFSLSLLFKKKLKNFEQFLIFSLLFFFRNRDVREIIKSWLIFCVWIFSFFAWNNKFLLHMCTCTIWKVDWFFLIFHVNFVWRFFFFFLWLKTVVFSEHVWCILQGDINYLKSQFDSISSCFLNSGYAFCFIVWGSFSFYICSHSKVEVKFSEWLLPLANSVCAPDIIPHSF